MTYQTFNPADYIRKGPQQHVAQTVGALKQASVQSLRTACAKWFAQPMTPANGARLWLINSELNARGIGPRWRGFGDFNPAAVPKFGAGNWPAAWGDAPLGDPMKRKLLVRWCDLAWLRTELGPSHRPKAPKWNGLFRSSTSPEDLETIYNALAWRDEANLRIVHDLSIPDNHRLALRGFVIAGAADKHNTVRRKLKGKIGPAMLALTERPTYALTQQQIDARMIYAQAIELARGSPTQAANMVRWMSGESPSPQALHQMRVKIAAEAGLMGKAWRPGA